jgi:hypothetical protein
MDLIKRNRLFFILFLLIITFLLYLTFPVLLSPVPKIKSISPQNNSTNVPGTTTITVAFEKTLKTGLIEVSLSPQINFQEKITDNVLEIKPVPFLIPGKTYTVAILDKTRNKELLRSTFQTLAPQGSSEAIKEVKKIQEEKYPLDPSLLPDTAPFYFTYTGPLKIKVFLKGNQTTAKQEFLNWVKSLGVDLSAHQIVFTSPP